MTQSIRTALIGVGNCASALVQGVSLAATAEEPEVCGIANAVLGAYTPAHIQFACAFDVDSRKVGRDLSDAIYAQPNCLATLCSSVKPNGTLVQMAPVLDGVASHVSADHERGVDISDTPEPTLNDVVAILKATGVEVVVNFLPVGAEQATRFFAEAAIGAGAAFVNCIPVFIASSEEWQRAFSQARLPILGDDIKSQIGATIINRALAEMFSSRGAELEKMYQLNHGGNTDFMNMLDRTRLLSKKKSKTEAVQSALNSRLPDGSIHVGPSDYVSFLNDTKVCYIRMEGRVFGGAPVHLDVKLSVEDSPNSAGVVIDAIRCAKICLDRKLAGAVDVASAYFFKHPPIQIPDSEACRNMLAFCDQ